MLKRERRARAGQPLFKARWHLFLLIWSILVLAFYVAISMRVGKYGELVRQENVLQERILEEEKRAAELRFSKEYYKSDLFVEKIAREQLDLVMPDEILFYNDARQE